MMNLSKIGWCDFSWNPVTGCMAHCGFCYGRKQATRLSGTIRINLGSPQIQKGTKQGLYILPAPFHNDADKVIAYPAGFAPTFHTYRLPMVADKKKPANIYVCSTGELFGEWVPDEWISDVFGACKSAPWHNYMFLTKHPERYVRLAAESCLPAQDNFWYGTYLAEGIKPFYSNQHHTFLDIDLTGAVPAELEPAEPEWMIVGCDTPLYRDSIPPEQSVLETLVQNRGNIPLFMKDSQTLRKIWNAPLIQEFPSLLQREPDKPIPHCSRCRQCLIICEGKRGNRHICRHRKILKEYKDTNGRHVPGRYARTSPAWCPKR